MANNMTMEEAIKNATKVTTGTPAVTLPTGAGKGKPAQEVKNPGLNKKTPSIVPEVASIKAQMADHSAKEVQVNAEVEPDVNTKASRPQDEAKETEKLEVSTTPLLTLAQLEKLYILDILQKSGNNKTKAAEILGVSLKTIYNKLASYEAKEAK